jgi:hypothetical protein
MEGARYLLLSMHLLGVEMSRCSSWRYTFSGPIPMLGATSNRATNYCFCVNNFQNSWGGIGVYPLPFPSVLVPFCFFPPPLPGLPGVLTPPRLQRC